jgi:hypothetical protein
MDVFDEDWRLSVSKVIANLTKEVHRLHVESMDLKEDVRNLRSDLQQELVTVESESVVAIQGIERKIQAMNSEFVNEIRQENEKDYRSLQRQFETKKMQTADLSQKLFDSVTGKILALRRQVSDLKKKVENRAKFVSDSQADLRRIQTETITKLKSRHQAILQKQVTRSNKEYNDFKLKSTKQEDSTKKKYDAEFESLKTKLTNDYQRAATSFSQAQRRIEGKIRRFGTERDEILAMVDQLTVFLTQSETQIQVEIDTVNQKRAKFDGAQKQLIEELKDRLEKLKTDHTEKRMRIESQIKAD